MTTNRNKPRSMKVLDPIFSSFLRSQHKASNPMKKRKKITTEQVSISPKIKTISKNQIAKNRRSLSRWQGDDQKTLLCVCLKSTANHDEDRESVRQSSMYNVACRRKISRFFFLRLLALTPCVRWMTARKRRGSFVGFVEVFCA
jgi:hypothetical protein